LLTAFRKGGHARSRRSKNPCRQNTRKRRYGEEGKRKSFPLGRRRVKGTGGFQKGALSLAGSLGGVVNGWGVWVLWSSYFPIARFFFLRRKKKIRLPLTTSRPTVSRDSQNKKVERLAGRPGWRAGQGQILSTRGTRGKKGHQTYRKGDFRKKDFFPKNQCPWERGENCKGLEKKKKEIIREETAQIGGTLKKTTIHELGRRVQVRNPYFQPRE